MTRVPQPYIARGRRLVLKIAVAAMLSADLSLMAPASAQTFGSSYTSTAPKDCRVTSAGRIIPIANGSTEITIRYGDKIAKLTLKTESCDVDLPINFGNQIVPIFTKLGCNGGGCHGKSGGQNGFALSLLGFVPELDYQTLVKEMRGRRIFPAAPDSSLLLLKMTGTMAHAGGKRMEVGSDEYKLLRRWIAAGAPLGKSTDQVVTKITIFPEHRIVARNNRQQLAVLAHYSDGTTEDVTHRAVLFFRQNFRRVDALHAVRALFHHPAAAHRDVRVAHAEQAWRGVVGEQHEIESPHLVRAVV